MSTEMTSERTLTPEPSTNPDPQLEGAARKEANLQSGEVQAAPKTKQELLWAARKQWFVMFCVFLGVWWGLGSFIYGTVYKDAEHVHRFKMTVADFDGGPVGAALLAAVQSVNGLKTYPTFQLVNASNTTPTKMEHDTFIGHNWGTIYATAGASARFAEVLVNESAGTNYDSSTAIVYAGAQARYVTSWASFLLPSLEQIVSTATETFARDTVMPLLTNGTVWTTNQARVLLNPVAATFSDLAPFPFGGRVFAANKLYYNLPILAAWLVLGAIGIAWTLRMRTAHTRKSTVSP
ncbi:hypothetical protein P7C70_g3824, partial [Phenoliferia sp. Uapishka_3]